MTLLTETSDNELQSALHGGINSLSRNQEIAFTQYTKQTISEDGTVFWVKGSNTLTVKGSFHYGSQAEQHEDEVIGVNSLIFTAEHEVTVFNDISPSTLWIAAFQVDSGADIYIAFSGRAPLYEQAGLWHYTGFAVYPALQSQLVASDADLPTGPIVSNSLPIWLNLPTALQNLPVVDNQSATVYASFLLPENIVPPYIVAHIEPNMTQPLQQFPSYDWTTISPSTATQAMPSYQLARDHIRLTFYGFTNQQCLQYLASLIAYSQYSDEFGFMSSPIFYDDKRTQPEISAIAMKKTLSFDASYYQTIADAIAKRLILSADISTTASN